MMSSRLNTGAIAPTSDVVDFGGYAPMQSYVGGFEPGVVMPGARPPLFQHQLYDTLDFAAAAFPFQEPSLFSGSAPGSNLQQQLAFSPQITMPMAPSSMQLPIMTLPGVPTAADAYPFGGGGGFLKRDDGPFADVGGGGDGRIGLNLGRRTYFSPADVLAVDRLLMRSRFGGGGAMGVLGLGLGAAHHHRPPRCQAEGCKADLSGAKHYHRRHKVCEYHAKAAAVATAGKQQRFCQQCSRFHVLGEFDGAKRSCRKRLTEHNRRRRKPAGPAKDSPPPSKKKAEASMTSSYTSDHKTNHKPTAISPNASSVFSCLLEVDNGQPSNATTAPTTLSLAGPPPPHDRDDGALDAVLMQRHVVQRRADEPQQHFMMTSLVQSHHQASNGGSGNILSCSSASDHQNGSCCNGGSNGNGNSNSMQHFFEVDFMSLDACMHETWPR